MEQADNIKVLIIDDEPSVRSTLEMLLKSEGHEPHVADDGQQALERISKQEFDVVLLDIRMPGLSGIDVLKTLQDDFPETSVVMVTAVADMATAVETMKLGAYDYITKPFDLDDVLMTVRRAFERRNFLLERKNYQASLEREVSEKTVHLEQKIQELNALNSLIQSRLNRVFATRDTYERAAREIKELKDQLEGLAEPWYQGTVS